MISHTNAADIDFGSWVTDERVNSELYTDERVFQREMATVFHNAWNFVGHETEIPNRGDYVRRTIGLDQVIVIREQDGVNVFMNRCSHRGTMLCDAEKGKKRALVCPFHGWAFNLKGELVDVPFRKGFTGEFSEFPLKAAKVETYRGFVFATFADNPKPLAEFLGRAVELFDRSIDMSPSGTVRLTGGWIKHKVNANWKIVAESVVDGAHPTNVHASFFSALTSRYDSSAQSEDDMSLLSVDWGNGHTEHDFSPDYDKPLQWFGTGASEEKFPKYVADMRAAYGEAAEEKLIRGASHATIFPNFFLAEMNVIFFQPISANETIQWSTPMYLDGVDDRFNQRIAHQSEGSLGPGSLVVPDDAVVLERAQVAFESDPMWLEISRGLHRERVEENGNIIGHFTDETTNRAFWKEYRKYM